MADFRYKARDKFSQPVAGTVAAENEFAAAAKLQEMGYVPISLEPAAQSAGLDFLRALGGVKLEEVNSFTRQLYSLQKAGLPLLSSLESVAQETPNKSLRSAVEEISRSIRGGLSFSAALKNHSQIFDDIYVSMVKAAETGGNLVEILEKLCALLERDIDTRSRIKAATRYPMLAFLTLCLGFLIVVTFVIPRFAAIYGQFNAELPLPTRVLIAISIALRKFWYLFILAAAGVVFAFVRFTRSSFGRPLWDNFKLKVPVVGKLMMMLVMSRFARVTAILMKSGVPILEVLDLVGGTSGNIIITRAIIQIKESITQGKGMSEPMKVGGLFPATVVQMVSVGEQTGRIDELLLNVADYYDTESTYLIKNLTTYIEPILILVLGAMVLVMALAIFLPMWNLIKIFRP
jgi:MSHA biogenesis protein MshG